MMKINAIIKNANVSTKPKPNIAYVNNSSSISGAYANDLNKLWKIIPVPKAQPAIGITPSPIATDLNAFTKIKIILYYI